MIATAALSSPLGQEALILPRPRVTALRLSNFRSYSQLKLSVDAQNIVLLGENGAGKTNILEALSLLAPGRGLRGGALEDMLHRGVKNDNLAQGWAAHFVLETVSGVRSVGLGVERRFTHEEQKERRNLLIDGQNKTRQTALQDLCALIWLTPAQDSLLRNGASERRAYFDTLVSAFNLQHSYHLNAYIASMRQRAKILKEGTGDEDWLSSIEDAMARHGVAVAEARLSYLSELVHYTDIGFGPFPGVELALQGDFEAMLIKSSALDVEDWARQTWGQARVLDRDSGRTGMGPHRSDLQVCHLEKKQLASLCSTGEQKALITALVLGHALLLKERQGRPPILLLDEVTAHFDNRKRDALFEFIDALNAQVWMTGVESAIFTQISRNATMLRVENSELYFA